MRNPDASTEDREANNARDIEPPLMEKVRQDGGALCAGLPAHVVFSAACCINWANYIAEVDVA